MFVGPPVCTYSHFFSATFLVRVIFSTVGASRFYCPAFFCGVTESLAPIASNELVIQWFYIKETNDLRPILSGAIAEAKVILIVFVNFPNFVVKNLFY